MGTWGTGLYADDFAKDLKAAVATIARLPFAPEELLAQLDAVWPGAANNPSDPDHTIFWLVVAEQLAARGIDSYTAKGNALSIIDSEADIAMMTARGMDAKSLAKRRSMLQALRARIAVPVPPAKQRTVLKKPQRFLLEVGEILIYPVSKGAPINPYAVGKEWAWVKAWRQDGWGALIIAERGLAFEYLAWYWPLMIGDVLMAEPTVDELLEPRRWLLGSPGTLTTRHRENLQFKSLGQVGIDAAKLVRAFPNRRRPPIACVVSDVSLSNGMTVRGSEYDEHLAKFRRPPTPRINDLSEIL